MGVRNKLMRSFLRDPVLQLFLVVAAIFFVAPWVVAAKQFIDANQVWASIDPNVMPSPYITGR